MAPAVSKFAILPFSCYDAGHTWSPHCTVAAAKLGRHTFRESLKIYGTLNLISLVVSRRIPKSFGDLIKLFHYILKSSAFLTMNSLGYIVMFCAIQKLLGGFNFFTVGAIPSFIGCYVSILIERPSRRPLLALYVTNVASETVFRMLRARGYVRDVKNFGFYMFVVSCATLAYHMKKGTYRKDIINSIFTKILGREEFNPLPEGSGNRDGAPEGTAEGSSESADGVKKVNLHTQRRKGKGSHGFLTRIMRFLLWIRKCFTDTLRNISIAKNRILEGTKHESCPHSKGCGKYCLHGLWTRFASGFGIQATIRFLLLLKQLLTKPKQGKSLNVQLALKEILLASLKSGVGLSAICCTFRFINCICRWLSGSGGSSSFPILASSALASAAGFAIIKPPSTLGLYLLFKAAETVITDSHRTNNWKIIRWMDSVYGGGWCLLYAISTATLFHTAVVEPQNLKPSYYKFLMRVTGGYLNLLNRHLLSVYGTNSDAMVRDFWPKYDPRFISENMKQLLKVRDERGSEFLQEYATRLMT